MAAVRAGPMGVDEIARRFESSGLARLGHDKEAEVLVSVALLLTGVVPAFRIRLDDDCCESADEDMEEDIVIGRKVTKFLNIIDESFHAEIGVILGSNHSEPLVYSRAVVASSQDLQNALRIARTAMEQRSGWAVARNWSSEMHRGLEQYNAFGKLCGVYPWPGTDNEVHIDETRRTGTFVRFLVQLKGSDPSYDPSPQIAFAYYLKRNKDGAMAFMERLASAAAAALPPGTVLGTHRIMKFYVSSM